MGLASAAWLSSADAGHGGSSAERDTGKGLPRSATQASVATVFAEPEIDTIEALTPTLEGNTARQ
jgi:hypothetical protein